MNYLIMTNTQPMSVSAFANVANGKGVAVYTNAASVKPMGTFTVTIGSRSVVLGGFHLGYNVGGAMYLIW